MQFVAGGCVLQHARHEGAVDGVEAPAVCRQIAADFVRERVAQHGLVRSQFAGPRSGFDDPERGAAVGHDHQRDKPRDIIMDASQHRDCQHGGDGFRHFAPDARVERRGFELSGNRVFDEFAEGYVEFPDGRPVRVFFCLGWRGGGAWVIGFFVV
jgi:hypothetical protein